MSSNIVYYAKIKDVASDKIYNLDTKSNDNQSSIFSLSLNDDIFDIYTYGIYTLKDNSGVFYSNLPFAEGHKYDITLGYIDQSQGFKIEKFITGEYYWSRNEIIYPEKGNAIAGQTLHHFTSSYHLKDSISLNNVLSRAKRAYFNKTASEVARELISADFIKDNKRILISKSKGTRDWYLLDKTSLEFIKNVLTKYSISLSNDSPFFSFFNLKNEFHFRSGFDLINNRPLPPLDFYTNQPPVIQDYVLNFSNPSFASDPTSVKNYNFIYVGTEEYQKVINSRSYTINSKNGLYGKMNTNLANQIYNPTGKLPIKNPNYFRDKRENNLKEIKYKGLFRDTDFYKAVVFNDYKNSVFSIRMNIVVLFNPEIVSGRVINLTCYDNNQNLNEVFSGSWIVIKSEHRYDLQEKLGNRMIMTILEIGKNSFKYDLDGGFYYDKTLKTVSTNILG